MPAQGDPPTQVPCNPGAIRLRVYICNEAGTGWGSATIGADELPGSTFRELAGKIKSGEIKALPDTGRCGCGGAVQDFSEAIRSPVPSDVQCAIASQYDPSTVLKLAAIQAGWPAEKVEMLTAAK